MDRAALSPLLRSFERHLRAENRSERTVASYLVRSARPKRPWPRGEIDRDPTAKMKRPIVPEQPIPVVPEDGLRRLLATCAGKSFEDRRDTALILLLVDVGPRRAELIGLKVSDVDFDLDVLLGRVSWIGGWVWVGRR
jgi:integrase